MHGLNVVVPSTDSRYAELRSNLVLKRPGSTDEEVLLDLNVFFGLQHA